MNQQSSHSQDSWQEGKGAEMGTKVPLLATRGL